MKYCEFIEQDIGKSQVSPIPLVGSAATSHALFYFIKRRYWITVKWGLCLKNVKSPCLSLFNLVNKELVTTKNADNVGRTM